MLAGWTFADSVTSKILPFPVFWGGAVAFKQSEFEGRRFWPRDLTHNGI